MEVGITASHSFIHYSTGFNQPMPSSERSLSTFSFFGLKTLSTWAENLEKLFACDVSLRVFIGVLLCIVGLILFQYHHFWIIYLEWLTNRFVGQEGPFLFLLKVWSFLLEGVGFYTIGLPESMQENFMDMKNSARDEHVRKKVMAKVLEDTN